MGINLRQGPKRDDTLKNRLEGVQNALGLDFGNKKDHSKSKKTGNRGMPSKSGGQRRVYAVPDDMDDPTDAIWIIPDKKGRAYVHEQPNPQTPVIRPATEEEVKKALDWDKKTLEMAKKAYGSESRISQDALQELRLFPGDARKQTIWKPYIGSPSTMNTN